MNLQEQILEELGTQMQSSIDFEILTDVLVNACGWYKIELERFTSREHSVDVLTWCQDKAQGNWKRNGCKFIFENANDAVMFTLKWVK